MCITNCCRLRNSKSLPGNLSVLKISIPCICLIVFCQQNNNGDDKVVLWLTSKQTGWASYRFIEGISQSLLSSDGLWRGPCSSRSRSHVACPFGWSAARLRCQLTAATSFCDDLTTGWPSHQHRRPCLCCCLTGCLEHPAEGGAVVLIAEAVPASSQGWAFWRFLDSMWLFSN